MRALITNSKGAKLWAIKGGPGGAALYRFVCGNSVLIRAPGQKARAASVYYVSVLELHLLTLDPSNILWGTLSLRIWFPLWPQLGRWQEDGVGSGSPWTNTLQWRLESLVVSLFREWKHYFLLLINFQGWKAKGLMRKRRTIWKGLSELLVAILCSILDKWINSIKKVVLLIILIH